MGNTFHIRISHAFAHLQVFGSLRFKPRASTSTSPSKRMIIQRHSIRSLSTMIKQPKNWKKLAPAPKPGTLTVAAQPSLPKLPVPTLNDTFTKLRRSLIPIAHTKEELLAVEQKISEFENGIAPELQKRLLKRHSETDHWLEEWWDAIAYNGYRDSVRTLRIDR